MNLDKLDLDIIRQLELDARQSARKLAAHFGISAATVSSRLRRMISDGTVSFYTFVDPVALGFSLRVVLCLTVVPGKLADVAEHLKKTGNVQSFTSATGRYDMLVYAVFEDNRKMIDWITVELGSIEGVISAEEVTYVRSIKDTYGGPFGERDLKGEIPPTCLDESGLKLIRELELSPTESIGGLGKKIGMSRWATSAKLKKLVDEKIVEVRPAIDSRVFGFVMHALIFVKVTPSRIFSIAETIAADSRVAHLSIVSGELNIVLHASFRDVPDLTSFVTDKVRCVPGVICSDTMILMGNPYRSYRLAGLLLNRPLKTDDYE